MDELRYKNVKWTIPFLEEKEIFIKPLNDFLNNYVSDENPIEAFYKNIEFPVNINSFILDKEIGQYSDIYNSQLLCETLDFNPNLFYDENFSYYLSFLNKYSASIVISNEFLLNFIRKKYPNIKVIASEILFIEKETTKDEVEFYNNLLQKYDRVILDPKYVEEKFMQDYDKFSDVSRLEIYANYAQFNSKDKKVQYDKTLGLNLDQIDFLIKKVGIKHFRLYKNKEEINYITENLFRYVFHTDAKYISILTEMIEHANMEYLFYGD